MKIEIQEITPEHPKYVVKYGYSGRIIPEIENFIEFAADTGNTNRELYKF